MSSYILKNESETFSRISHNRKLIGTVSKSESGWSGRISASGHSFKVTNFATRENAFFALTRGLKTTEFNARTGSELVALAEGSDMHSEARQLNAQLETYVAACNKDHGRDYLRVVHRRG